jgi:FkbM family methyltransferase
MNIVFRIRANIADAICFGPQFLLRHLRRKSPLITTKINGVGQLSFRPRSTDVPVLRQVFLDRQYDIPGAVSKRVIGRYHEILEAGKIPTIVDAGANIGAASIWFSGMFPKCAVVAIEPEPGNAAVLRKNIKASPAVIFLEAAIGSRAGYVAVPHITGWAARTERSDHGIPIVTMQEAFGRVPNGIPFIAKIDIEGFESDLFSTNVGWLDEVQVLFIEPHDWMMPEKRTSRGFQQAMGERDFDIFLSGDNLVYVRA